MASDREPDVDHDILELEAEPEAEFENVSEPIAEIFTTAETSIWLILYIVWILLIVILNIFTIVAIIKSKILKKNVSNIFLLSLVIARTMVAVLVMPARITGLFSNEALGPILCKLCHFAGQGSAAASVFSTCCVAISKYYEKDKKGKIINWKHAMFVTIGIWLVSYTYAIRAAFLNNLILVPTSAGDFWACSADTEQLLLNQIFIFVDLLVLFIIPVVIISVCYVQVLIVLNNRLGNKAMDVIISTAAVNKDMQREISDVVLSNKTKAEKDVEILRGIRLTIAVMIVFVVCYAASNIWKLYIFFSGTNVFTGYFINIEQAVYLISYANPWVNVFLYLYFRQEIRENFCTRCLCKTTKDLNEILVDKEVSNKIVPASTN